MVLRREKKGSNDGQGGGNSRQEPGNARWGGKNRDCAGLVRYLFWEAFQPHAGRFFDSYPELQRIPQVDLHEFRAVATQWSEANFTAPQLIAHSRFLGKNAATLRLKTGDLLYFHSAELKIRHVMLVIRSRAEIFLVYHTGDARNELRIRTLADINTLPESEWHIDVSNPVFRGVYRPDFLD